MKERPILFSGSMVRALLAGTKTQTRRVVKGRALDWLQPGMFNPEFVALPDNFLSPYGFPGDRLYVRETWQHSNHPLGPYHSDCLVFYRADYLDDPHGPDGERSPEGRYREWRPSIHMPRSASRILLEVTVVRIERLQVISEEDAVAEGVEPYAIYGGKVASWKATDKSLGAHGSAREAYRELWDSLNASRGYGWETNPWVWVVEFKKVGA